MPNFAGMKLTRHGMELLGLVGTGTVLDFTRIAVGSGNWNDAQQAAPAELSTLIHEEMSLDVGSIEPTSVPDTDEPAGCYTLHAMLTNTGLAFGFALREIGIFATHPTRGEILYAVDYAGDQYDYIPALPAGAAPLEKQFRIDVVTGNAKEITIKQSPVLLATLDTVDNHNTDPEAHPDLLDRLATGISEILSPANNAENVGETPLYRFREFAPTFAEHSEEAIQVQIDLETGNFSNPVHDSGFLTTIAGGYEQPAGMLQAGKIKYKVRCRRRLNNGLISPWSEIVIFETRDVFNYVARTTNISPSTGATKVQEDSTFVSSAFAVVGDAADTHTGTRFRVRQGDTVIYDSGLLGSVTEHTIPEGHLQTSNDYVWECQHVGENLGAGEWSTATSFHTAAAFVTGDEALSYSTWDGYDNASAAGVALADDAALRSNGVDQGELEGDWVSFKTRAKVRDKQIALLPGTRAVVIKTTAKIVAGDGLITDQGRCTAGNVTDETVHADSSVDLWEVVVGEPDFVGDDVHSGVAGAARTTTPLVGDFTVEFHGYQESGQNLCVGFVPVLQLETYTSKAERIYLTTPGCLSVDLDNENLFSVRDDSDFISQKVYAPGDLIKIERIGSTFNFYRNGVLSFSVDDVSTEEMYIHVGSHVSGPNNRAANLNWDIISHSVDISAAGFTSAPTRAHKMPKITAATGAVGTAFTAEYFNEIPVETATLGTDTDTDRPDFILLESAKQTPETPFRRVALGVSGLSKDSETRISETQCDTWKQGA